MPMTSVFILLTKRLVYGDFQIREGELLERGSLNKTFPFRTLFSIFIHHLKILMYKVFVFEVHKMIEFKVFFSQST